MLFRLLYVNVLFVFYLKPPDVHIVWSGFACYTHITWLDDRGVLIMAFVSFSTAFKEINDARSYETINPLIFCTWQAVTINSYLIHFVYKDSMYHISFSPNEFHILHIFLHNIFNLFIYFPRLFICCRLFSFRIDVHII